MDIKEESNPKYKHSVELTFAKGLGHVKIDGVELENVMKVVIDVGAMDLPQTTITTIPQNIIYEGESDVFINVGKKKYRLQEVKE